MSKNERGVLAAILLFIFVFIATDLVSDSAEGSPTWHLIAEAFVAAFALYGVYRVLKGSFELKQNLEIERKNSEVLKAEALKWKAESKKYLQGLSQIIDQQLSDWNLTTSEKEVAFLLLKGLSLKEIAEVRSTSEKTARAQSTAVYSKSGLSGRSELAAFFLEDLLLPQNQNEDFSKLT